MVDLNQTLEALSKELISLKNTTKVTDELLKKPKWYFLQHHYNTVCNPIGKAVVSVWNSIITQERVIFLMSRDNVRKLVSEDKNWDEQPGLDNNSWKAVIQAATESGLIKRLSEGSGNQPSVYELIDPDTLKYVAINRNDQLNQTVEFIKRKYPKYGESILADSSSDTEVRTQNIAHRTKNIELRTKNEEPSHLDPFNIENTRKSDQSVNQVAGSVSPVLPAGSVSAGHPALMKFELPLVEMFLKTQQDPKENRFISDVLTISKQGGTLTDKQVSWKNAILWSYRSKLSQLGIPAYQYDPEWVKKNNPTGYIPVSQEDFLPVVSERGA